MRTLTSTLTDRGQTTIPAAVRKAFKLKPRQQIIYEIRGEDVLIRSDRENPIELASCLKSEVMAGTKADERDNACAARLRRYL
jgi:bifunctional DNA-binding transcriptional regulator/antitoxin component of YhaV-PrlF toxin-antitoxin module